MSEDLLEGYNPSLLICLVALELGYDPLLQVCLSYTFFREQNYIPTCINTST